MSGTLPTRGTTMSKAVNKALVVGGGFSGMSAAIQLRKSGVDVDLVEIDPASVLRCRHHRRQRRLASSAQSASSAG